MKLTNKLLMMVALVALLAAACNGESTEVVRTSASVNASVIPELTAVSDLEEADPGEEHVSYAPDVPPPITRDDQRAFDVRVEVLENVCPLDPENDVFTEMWGFRVEGDAEVVCGSPGPVLRGRVGDLARITLTNLEGNTMPHNIDFHAVTGQGGGAADLTVAPGETATIEARLLYSGAFMYHCAFGDVPLHMAKGMYGMFIVDPEVPLPKAEHEWAVMQSEWYVGDTDADGVAPFDRDGLVVEEPKYVTFNGRTDALSGDNALTMQVGERARIYMVNEGLNLDSNWHPIGSQWDTVYPEAATTPGNPVIRGSQSTLVVAGGGTITELVGLVPSTILLVDHALVRTFYKGALGQVVVEGDENSEIFAAEGTGTSAAAEGQAAEPDARSDQVIITEGAFDPANADDAFSPRVTTVPVGTTVTWTNEDGKVVHTVTSGESDGTVGTPDGLFDSGNMKNGDTFSFTFAEPGTYEYHCTPHPWMMGTVIVEG